MLNVIPTSRTYPNSYNQFCFKLKGFWNSYSWRGISTVVFVITPRYCNSHNVKNYHLCIGMLLPLLSCFASDRRCLQDCGIFMASLYHSGTCEVCIPPILDTGCRRILHYLLDFYMVQLIMGTTLSGTLSYAAIMLCLSNVKIVVQRSNVRAIKKTKIKLLKKKEKKFYTSSSSASQWLCVMELLFPTIRCLNAVAASRQGFVACRPDHIGHFGRRKDTI